MDNAHKPSDSEWCIPSSEPFRLYLHFRFMILISWHEIISDRKWQELYIELTPVDLKGIQLVIIRVGEYSGFLEKSLLTANKYVPLQGFKQNFEPLRR
jgi:hypothetical protein